ncbi:IclR family transcriptional regulator [Alcaligenaceae bacterium]|nr:IclR family transcriptional regulator [Alcaligenaceae bacterium]
MSKSSDGLSLTDLSLELESPKSSLLNLLRPLVTDGYLVNDGGCYRLGPSIYRLSAHILASWDFPRLIRPFMEELAGRSGESVLLSVLNRDAEVATYVEIIPSPHPVRYQIPVGTTRPLYASSAGRLLLAYADKAWRDSYLKSVTFKSKTAVPMNRAWLRQDVEQIRIAGAASSIDVYTIGLAAVTAPVFEVDGHCVAALTLAGPTERFRHELESKKAMLLDVAARASGIVIAKGGEGGFY